VEGFEEVVGQGADELLHFQLLYFGPLEFPEDAFREAIFNAIIHKQYAGVPIQINKKELNE